MNYSDLIAALGLALVLEGAAYALFPDAMRSMMTRVLALPVTGLRLTGLVATLCGVTLVWLIRG